MLNGLIGYSMNLEETIKAVEQLEMKPLKDQPPYRAMVKATRKSALRFLRKYGDVIKDAYCHRVWYDGSLKIVYELKEIIRVQIWFLSDYSCGLDSYVIPDGDAVGHFNLVMKTQKPMADMLKGLLDDKYDYERTMPFFKEKQDYIRRQRKSPDNYYNTH